MTCDDCKQNPATNFRYGGGVFSPICAECAKWWTERRIYPLDEPGALEDWQRWEREHAT